MAAATQTVPALITLEEYLHTAYHPDCDFVDGFLEERNMGGTKHGVLQAEVGFWFRLRKGEWKILPVMELRTRVAATRVRLPDVSVVRDDAALNEELRVTPPLIAIEILSPDDRLPRVVKRLREFVAMGAEHVWLLDPVKREAFVLTADGLDAVTTNRISIPNSPIYMDLTEVFSALDFAQDSEQG
jgi:Uma2 family endonuclease